MKEVIGISEIDGFRIGNAQNYEYGSGCTVILCTSGALGGCDTRGGGPASRETALLSPMASNKKVHAIVLSGGSAFGLDSCSGVMRFLEEKKVGVEVGIWRVPIVSGACIFDFNVTDGLYKPDSELGYLACLDAEKNNSDNIIQGNIGAGTGATVGKISEFDRAMKAGLGSHAIQVGDLQIGAVVCVNAIGNVYDYDKGEYVAGLLDETKSKVINPIDFMCEEKKLTLYTGNTTIACIITNAKISKSELNKVASVAHNGYARTIIPVHTTADGDTIFALSTNKVSTSVDLVGALATECIEKAIIQGTKAAKGFKGYLSYSELVKNMKMDGNKNYEV